MKYNSYNFFIADDAIKIIARYTLQFLKENGQLIQPFGKLLFSSN